MSSYQWVSKQEFLDSACQLVMKSRQKAAKRGLLVALSRHFEFEKFGDTFVESATTSVGASLWKAPSKGDLTFEWKVR